jgi:hypothetical protein
MTDATLAQGLLYPACIDGTATDQQDLDEFVAIHELICFMAQRAPQCSRSLTFFGRAALHG